MPTLPPDSEQDEIEVTFNSCTGLTVTVHNHLKGMLLDPKNVTDPSKSKGQGFVDIELTVVDPSKTRINWGYSKDPKQDHGNMLLDEIPAPGVPNPLDVLRKRIADLEAELASRK